MTLSRTMRYLSVCSGMEAASIAFEPLGWKAVAFAEIDPFASAVLAHRFPDIPNYGDLTQHTDPTKWPISAGDVDLIIGGPPCQAFSVAGLRRGLADPRGSVTLSYLSLVDRLRPEWIIYENVPGLLSVDGGSTFGGFLHALGQLGYGWAYRILDAQHVGECRLHPHRRGWSAVPQRRRRVFVVARRGAGGWASSAEVLSLGEGLRRHLASGGKKRQGPAADAGAGVEKGCWWDGGQVSQTLDAVLQKGQTMPEKNRFPAVMQPVCATGDHTHALTASSSKGATEDGTGRGSPIVIDRAAFNQGENAQYDPHIGEADVMDTVVARGPHAIGVRDAEAIVPIQDGRDIEKRQNGLWVGKPGDPAYTVDTTGTQALCVPLDGMNLLSRLGECGETHSMQEFNPAEPQFTLRRGGQQHGVLTPMAVRRLTPNECLRLQGFPDNHANIPWKGKPEGQAPDGPQYKCAGNSFAVPVVRWLGKRIADLMAKESQ